VNGYRNGLPRLSAIKSIRAFDIARERTKSGTLPGGRSWPDMRPVNYFGSTLTQRQTLTTAVSFTVVSFITTISAVVA